MQEPVAPGLPPHLSLITSTSSLPARECHPPQEWWRTPFNITQTCVESSDESHLKMTLLRIFACRDRMEFIFGVPEHWVCVQVGSHSNDQRPSLKPWHVWWRPVVLKQHMRRIQALLNKGTWKTCQVTPRSQAIGSRWVFLLKPRRMALLITTKVFSCQGYSHSQALTLKTLFPYCQMVSLHPFLHLLHLRTLTGEHWHLICIPEWWLGEESIWATRRISPGSLCISSNFSKTLWSASITMYWHKKLDKFFRR